MRHARRITTRAAARHIRKLRDKCTPAPFKGVRFGSGKFSKGPDTWNGDGWVPSTWTGLHGAREEYDDTEDEDTSVGWRVDFPEDMQALLDGAGDKLTSAEVRQLQTALDESEEEPEHVEGEEPPHRPRPRPKGWRRKKTRIYK